MNLFPSSSGSYSQIPGDHFGVYDGECINYFSVVSMCGSSRYKMIFIIIASIFISIGMQSCANFILWLALILCFFCAYSFWCTNEKKSQYKKITEKKPMVN